MLASASTRPCKKNAKAVTVNSGDPDVEDIIEFTTAAHAFKASAKVAKMANEMQGAILNIKA